MVENGRIDQFLVTWQAINRHLRKGTLLEEDKGITRLQWILLRHVDREKTCPIGYLAEHFGVSPSTISQMADRLEKSGLLHRVTDPQDARVRLVSLTQKGQELIRSVESVWGKRLAKGLGQFPDPEQKDFLEKLERLAASLSESVR